MCCTCEKAPMLWPWGLPRWGSPSRSWLLSSSPCWRSPCAQVFEERRIFFLLREIDYSSSSLFARTHLSLRFRFVSVIATNQSLLKTEKDNWKNLNLTVSVKRRCGEKSYFWKISETTPTLSLLYFVRAEKSAMTCLGSRCPRTTMA